MISKFGDFFLFIYFSVGLVAGKIVFCEDVRKLILIFFECELRF
jgi:hypothetical protein